MPRLSNGLLLVFFLASQKGRECKRRQFFPLVNRNIDARVAEHDAEKNRDITSDKRNRHKRRT